MSKGNELIMYRLRRILRRGGEQTNTHWENRGNRIENNRVSRKTGKT